MPKDEARSVASYLIYGLGFPLGIIAIVGALAVGFAVFRDEISLGNRRFTFGMLLLCFCAAAYHLPRIYPVVMWDDEGSHRGFSLSSLLWAVAGGAGIYFFGLPFISLMRQ